MIRISVLNLYIYKGSIGKKKNSCIALMHVKSKKKILIRSDVNYLLNWKKKFLYVVAHICWLIELKKYISRCDVNDWLNWEQKILICSGSHMLIDWIKKKIISRCDVNDFFLICKFRWATLYVNFMWAKSIKFLYVNCWWATLGNVSDDIQECLDKSLTPQLWATTYKNFFCQINQSKNVLIELKKK
jgi:hypothetical protein